MPESVSIRLATAADALTLARHRAGMFRDMPTTEMSYVGKTV